MGFWRSTRPLRARLLVLLAVLGPGIITANVDNDAGGIATYSVSGAHYGYDLLWMMPVIALALVIVQEMSARLGVVTGQGLADLIRESLGVRATVLVVGVLLIANYTNVVSEFAGVAASMEIFGVTKFISVPLVAVGVWVLIVRANYRIVERVFLVASFLYVSYVISGVLAKPPWNEVAAALVHPKVQLDSGYLVMMVTVIGTTIAPWMQFYQQSSIADKGLKVSDIGYERVDVLVGSLFAVLVAAFISVACAATLHSQGIRVEAAEDAARALRPLAGVYASTLFALGLLNASVFAAAILPLSTAYVVCEALGLESGVSKGLHEAPVFFTIFTAMIALGAGVVLLPIGSLVQAMLVSQTLNGLLLPVILLVMLRLISDRRLMGRHANGSILNAATWLMVLVLTVLAAVLVLVTIWPGLLG